MARRGSVRSSPHSSSLLSGGGSGSGWPAEAMESLETPVKDGVLYQLHVKFGKVGTPVVAWGTWGWGLAPFGRGSLSDLGGWEDSVERPPKCEAGSRLDKPENL